jgi:predicted deacylase
VIRHDFIHNFKFDNFEIYRYGFGPLKLAISAGIHGDEQTAVYTAGRIMEFLETAELSGSAMVLPICNPTAFRNRSRESPVDNADLNRSFCKEGSLTFSAKLAQKIWETVKDAPFLLDLHCCGQIGSLYVMAMHESIESQGTLAKVLGIPHVVQSSEVEGQLFVNMNRSGKQALLIEMPGGQPWGVINKPVSETVFRSALRFIEHSGLIRNKADAPDKVLFHGRMKRVLAEHNGLFIPKQQPGTCLKEGDIVGDFSGTVISMPFDGTLLAVQNFGYIFEGERLFMAAPLSHGGNHGSKLSAI